MHFSNEEESGMWKLLKCRETYRWSEELLNDEWLHMNEEVAYNLIITCTKITEFKKNYIILYKLKCTLED